MEQIQLYVGLDVHKDSITATIKDDVGKQHIITFNKL